MTTAPEASDSADSSETQPIVRDNVDAGRFEIIVDGVVAGTMTYKVRGEVLIAIHTEIDDSYGGRGLASQLVRTVLDLTRNTGLLVRADCPFVSAYIAKHPEYSDLVKEA